MFEFTNTDPDFFIQLKGNDAGRHLLAAIPNSIGVKVDQRVLVPAYFYQVIQYLFLSGKFKPETIGSVVPYIRQRDFARVVARFFSAERAITVWMNIYL